MQLLARPDGTLVTEKTQTRQHEVLFDDDLPGDERLSTGIDQVDCAERIIDQKVSSGIGMGRDAAREINMTLSNLL